MWETEQSSLPSCQRMGYYCCWWCTFGPSRDICGDYHHWGLLRDLPVWFTAGTCAVSVGRSLRTSSPERDTYQIKITHPHINHSNSRAENNSCFTAVWNGRLRLGYMSLWLSVAVYVVYTDIYVIIILLRYHSIRNPVMSNVFSPTVCESQ